MRYQNRPFLTNLEQTRLEFYITTRHKNKTMEVCGLANRCVKLNGNDILERIRLTYIGIKL